MMIKLNISFSFPCRLTKAGSSLISNFVIFNHDSQFIKAVNLANLNIILVFKDIHSEGNLFTRHLRVFTDVKPSTGTLTGLMCDLTFWMTR